MYKVVFAAVMAAGLIAAPLPALSQSMTAPAEPAKTETKTDTKTEAKTKKSPWAGVGEMRARQTKCAAEWKEAKAAGKVEKGQKWPQFWSACNKRLKAAG